MATYTSPYTLDECDEMVLEHWEEWKKNHDKDVYDFIDLWLEERWRAMGNAVESS
jgi:hypothetical protein